MSESCSATDLIEDMAAVTYDRLHLANNDVLFFLGEQKTHFYKIEQGAICVSRHADDDTMAPIQFYFSGAFLGLGYLDRHICQAVAAVETTATRIPRTQIDSSAANDPVFDRKQSDAIAYEFASQRSIAVAQSRRNTSVQQLARFLMIVSMENQIEGRDPLTVSDDLESAVVSELLKLDTDALGAALVSLREMNLVELSSGGSLRLCDRAGLERLADEEVDAETAT